MKARWMMVITSAAALLAGHGEASAEGKKISCAAIPYVRHWLDTKAKIPRCTMEHVSEAGRTYTIYRDVTQHDPSMAIIIVLYKASQGAFPATPEADLATLGRHRANGTADHDTGPWAFDGFLQEPPKKVESGPGPGYYRFEAPVAVLGGALATCWAGFKHPSSPGSDEGTGKREANATYAAALTCVTKDYRGVLPEDTAYKPIWDITLK